MKTDRDSEQDPNAGILLRLAERSVERVLKELDAVLGDLETREDGSVARAKITASEVRKAIQTVFDERHRLDKLTDTGRSPGQATLDLDAARAEIGRRLALLRERRGSSDGIPDPE